jgi:hypothetical protein
MGRDRLRRFLWAVIISAVGCGISCTNSLSEISFNEGSAYYASLNPIKPSIDSFVITSGTTTHTGIITFTLASQSPGEGATSITGWQVKEGLTTWLSSDDPGWNTFTSPVNGTYTLSDLGTYRNLYIYAWLKNDRGSISQPVTHLVQYTATP